MNWTIHRYPSVDSTMRVAAPLPVGSVVVAQEQTGGIGRHGHTWDSERHAGLYTSIVLPPGPVLTLALGLAAAAAVESVTSLPCDIRWPNDLMLQGRKLGGILVQLQDNRAIAGIGINVGQTHFSPELSPLATSLAIETGLEFRAEDILDALLRELVRWIHRSPPEIVSAWQKASTWASGKPVRVDLGNRSIKGITAGLDDAGFLRVRKHDGSTEVILAGSVRPL